MASRVLSGRARFEIIGGDCLESLEEIKVRVLGRVWTIEKGTRTDLASFPVIGYALYDPYEGAVGSFWHDDRYKRGDISRSEADLGWYELVISGHSEETRMPKWKARIGWLGLRAGGWWPWRKYRKADAQRW